MRRYLPFVLIALFLAFGAQALFHKKTTKGPTASVLTTQTISAAHLVDKGEQAYKSANGRFTSHIADLVGVEPALASDFANGISFELDASTDGNTYLSQVSSSVLGITRVFHDTKVTSQSCVVIKSGSGVACPVVAAKTP